jgi:hypothetical protein
MTNKIGPGAQGVPNGPPSGYRVLGQSEVNSKLGSIAKSLLSGDYGKLTPFEMDGKKYAGRVEPHYHQPPPIGANPNAYPKPWGWHKGVTLYYALSNNNESSTQPAIINKNDKVNNKLTLLEKIDNLLGFK